MDDPTTLPAVPTLRISLDGTVLTGSLEGVQSGRIVLEPRLVGGEAACHARLVPGDWQIDALERDGEAVILAVSRRSSA